MRAHTLREWTRRDFLRAAGIGASASMLAPFIPVASAQVAASGIKRLVLFSHPDGTVLNRWRSNGTGTPLVAGRPDGSHVEMQIPQLVGPILNPLERHRPALCLVDGLDQRCGWLPKPGTTNGNLAAHEGISILWSGSRRVPAPANSQEDPSYSNAATIDQILAQASSCRFPSIIVSPDPAGRGSYDPTLGISSYSGPSQPLPPDYDPQVVFDRIFGSGLNTGVNAALQRRAARLSIFSSIRGELSRVRQQLPSVDQQRLDLHLNGLDALDQRITAQSIQPCSAPTPPTVTTDPDPAKQILIRLAIFNDIVSHAFACDLSRVANIMLGSEASSPGWLPGKYLGVHTLSHQTYIPPDGLESTRRTVVDQFTGYQTAVAEQFAELLDALDSGPGPTLLSDTLCVWGTAMGWGGPHVSYGTPFVLASKHPSFRAGYYHRYGTYDLDIDTSVPANPYQEPSVITPHNKLLTTIMHLMGRTDIQAVGDPGTNGEIGGADLDNTPLTELIS